METTEETTAVNTVETTENVGIEALQAELDEANDKNKTLWDKIYKLKKENKDNDKLVTWFWKEDMESMLNERDFFKTNPDLVEYKDKINEFTSKWISFEDAKTLVTTNDSTISNRQTTNKSNFTAWEPSLDNLNFTKEQLWDMNRSEYKQAMSLIESWKATKVL